MGGSKVAFAGARPLGVKILEWLIKNVDLQVVFAEPPDSNRWWRRNGAKGVCELALENNIPVVFDSKHLSDFPSDLLLSVKTDHIFSRSELDRYPLGGVNLHTAPLPDYRGCNCLSHAIINQEPWYGVTLHWMDEKVDAGPIITRTMFPITEDETAWSLEHKLLKHSYDLFVSHYEVFSLGRKKVPGYYNTQKGIYYKRTQLATMKELHRSMSDEQLYRMVRAMEFKGFEPAFFRLSNGKKIYLRSTYD